MEKNVFVYKLNGEELIDEETYIVEDRNIEVWTPSLFNCIPPNSPNSYFFFWLMKTLRLFKNDNYRAYSIVSNNEAICSLVCVPALNKWKFMTPDGIQIKNVFTHPDHRGKGLASNLLKYVLHKTNSSNKVFWYMTDEFNIASQKLCKKVGFRFVGRYYRNRNRFLLYEGDIVPNSETYKLKN